MRPFLLKLFTVKICYLLAFVMLQASIITHSG